MDENKIWCVTVSNCDDDEHPIVFGYEYVEASNKELQEFLPLYVKKYFGDDAQLISNCPKFYLDSLDDIEEDIYDDKDKEDNCDYDEWYEEDEDNEIEFSFSAMYHSTSEELLEFFGLKSNPFCVIFNVSLTDE